MREMYHTYYDAIDGEVPLADQPIKPCGSHSSLQTLNLNAAALPVGNSSKIPGGAVTEAYLLNDGQ